jgi:NTE family protein
LKALSQTSATEKAIKSIASEDELLIDNIKIFGNSMKSPDYFDKVLNLKEGIPIRKDSLISKIRLIRDTGDFAQLKHHLVPLDNKKYQLVFNVKESENQTVSKITVRGNDLLSRKFIKRLLGYKVKDILNYRELEQRITTAYSLGYFETITYEIHSLSDSKIHLKFNVKEKLPKRLYLGARWDNHYGLVGVADIHATYWWLPGLQFEYQSQFAGLIKNTFKIYYPSRTLDIPVFPFVKSQYSNRQLFTIDDNFSIIEEDYDASFLGGGFGLLLYKYGVLELEYDILKSNLNSFNAYPRFSSELIVDNLDNALIPSDGIKTNIYYEKSNEVIQYEHVSSTIDVYHSNRRDTYRLFGKYSQNYGDTPHNLFNHNDVPNYFPGYEMEQILFHNFSAIGIEYRYHRKNSTYLRILVSHILSAEYINNSEITSKTGYGFGVTLKSPFGPLEFMWGWAEKDLTSQSSKLQSNFTFNMGYKF